MNIPIHVGIPSYNNAIDLKRLLGELSQQKFASITVLDDASTDDTQSMLSSFPDVKCIRSEVNLGTVGANNLMLRNMPESGFILFIDSDMMLETKNIPEALSLFISQHPNIGAGVGKIINQKGEATRWNYNYDLNPLRSLFAFLTYHPAVIFKNVPGLGAFLRIKSLLFTMHLADDDPKKIDWGIEAFFFVRVDLFKDLQGFDSRFKRFHEGPDLFLQIRKRGFETWFTPSIVARDIDQHTGTTWERRYHWWRSYIIYFWKNPSRLLMYRVPRP